MDAYLDGFLLFMTETTDFKFTINVSQQRFETKPTREQIAKIVFQQEQQTMDSTLKYALQGRAFCSSFSTSSQDGLITMRDKIDDRFLSSSMVCFDFDDMTVSLLDYIKTLSYKPSIAYSTYSDGEDGYSNFRLVYVFKDPITSVEVFDSVYHAIADANGFIKEERGRQGGLDVRGAAQMYFGTFQNASTYNGNVIYTQDDFKPYVTSTTRQEAARSFRKKTIIYNKSSIDKEFFRDLVKSPKVLIAKYWDLYHENYVLSLSTPLILDKSKMFYKYPDQYHEVFHKRIGKTTIKWQVGTNRKRRIYATAKVMLFNLPSLSIENLIYNLVFERQYYYENYDKKISDDVLIDAAINAFKKKFKRKSSKHGAFKVNKKHFEEQGKNVYQGKAIIQNYCKAREVMKFYNPDLTNEENLRIMKENGIEISERTLRRILSREDIKINTKKQRRTYLSCCPDSDTILMLRMIADNDGITLPEIERALNVSSSTVNRRVAAIKDVYIRREGNNRKGRWELTSLARQELQKLKTNKKDKK